MYKRQVHYPGVCLGAVPYTGVAQEPFQPGWAVRQDQQSALPFAGGRLQEYDELPVKIVREGAALLVELFQLHTVVIDHLIGGYGTVLVEDQLQGLRPAVYLFLLVRIQAAAVDRQDVRLSDVL